MAVMLSSRSLNGLDFLFASTIVFFKCAAQGLDIAAQLLNVVVGAGKLIAHRFNIAGVVVNLLLHAGACATHKAQHQRA